MYTLTFDSCKSFEFAHLYELLDYFRLCMNLSTYSDLPYIVTDPAGTVRFQG